MFEILDYVVLIGMLVFSMGIGIFYAVKGRQQNSAKEYFTASGSMGVLPTTFSLLASVLCSIWYIGFPSEVYEFGMHFAWDFPMLPIGLILVAYGFLPVFYDLGVTSANEYLERRFNRTVRLIGSVLYILNSGLYVAMVTYIPALSVSQVTGLHLWISIALMSLVGTTYTAIGGIRAVMWTDVFQMIIIYVSMLAIVIKGTIDLGGVSIVFERSIEGRRFALPPATVDPRYRYNILSVILMCCLYWVGLYGTSQTQVQRYLSCPTKKKAQMTVWLNLLAFWLLEIIIVYMSLMLYAYFLGCDPKLNNQIGSYDELLTFFVMKTFREIPGLPGLFVAGVFSGALSTISSCLNSMAAVTMEDFVVAIPKFSNLNDKTKTNTSRFLALFYGMLTIGLMTIIERLHSVITFWGYNNGLLLGCMAGLFMLGLFVPWANTSGAVAGFFFTYLFGLIISVGAQILGVEFYSEPLSTSTCDASSSNISEILNATANFTNEFFPQENSTLRLYSILPDRGGFKEIFTVSPHIMHPFSLIFVIVIGSIASLFFGTKHETELKLLSPLIRPLVKRKRKNAVDKIYQFDLIAEKNKVNDEELQIFLNGNEKEPYIVRNENHRKT